MKKHTILVLDDESRIASKYEDRLKRLPALRGKFDIESTDSILEIVELLTRRQLDSRAKRNWRTGDCPFDGAAILIIDYDLASFKKGKGLFVTGEGISYLARCFSTCNVIVGLNQYGRNPFDLTLNGHPESYADLNIGSDQIDNAGLWGGEVKGFRPWHWPTLPHFLQNFEKRTRDVMDHFTDSIANTLGLSDAVNLMPNSALRFLSGDPQITTFREFVVHSKNGLKGKDVAPGMGSKSSIPRDILAKIAAARICKWLERMILPGQDILIDAPHLVSRFSGLLKGDQSVLKTWNQTARFASYDELGIDNEKIEKYMLKKEYWLSRAVWFWNPIMSCQDLPGVKEPWKIKRPRFFFCEDTSAFALEADCLKFRANLESVYADRFIRKPDNSVIYEPLISLFSSPDTVEGPDKDD